MRLTVIAGLWAVLVAVVASAVSLAVTPAPPPSSAPIVTGTVRLEGRPVAATTVGWFDPHSRSFAQTTTDAGGRYRLTLDPAVPFVVFAGVEYLEDGDREHSDSGVWAAVGGAKYLPAFAGATGTDHLYQSLSAFRSGSGSKRVDVALERPSVLVASSEEMVGAAVELTTNYGQAVRSARADSSGSITFDDLFPGTYRIALPDRASFAPYRSDPIEVAAGAPSRVSPSFPGEGGIISGRITVEGAPAVGVTVEASSETVSSGAETDVDGRYSLSPVPRGEYTLVVNGGREGQPDNEWTRGEFPVAVESSTTVMNVELDRTSRLSLSVPSVRADATVRATLLDGEGDIVASRIGRSESDGPIGMTLTGFGPGAYTLVVTGSDRDRYAMREITVPTGSSRLGTVALDRRTATMSGRVFGASAGEVTYEDELASEPLVAEIDRGRYELTGLVPDRLGTVSVIAEGHESSRTVVAAHDGGTEVDLEAGPGFGDLRAAFTAGGYPVTVGSVVLSRSSEFLGALQLGADSASTSVAGTVLRMQIEPARASYYQFVVGSPYWLFLPGSRGTVSVDPFGVTDAGTVELDILR